MKIVLVGLNYKEHAQELGMDLPQEPVIFVKPESAIVGNGDNIVLPQGVGRVDYEGEIAVVIGRPIKGLCPSEVTEHVLWGVTALNDVTARDLQKKDGQWIRAKGFPSFCPIGNKLLSYDLKQEIILQTFLNGQQVQYGSSKDFIFDVRFLVSFVSKIFPLMPGDIISTGTPVGVGQIKPGDVVEVKVSIGEDSVLLRNYVI